MLQKAFFKVDVVDRIYDTPVFEKTTPGAYEFTIPDGYNYVVVEYAGAGGGPAYRLEFPSDGPGKGAILKKKEYIKNRTIKGIVASTATNYWKGGTGYSAGKDGAHTVSNNYGGGGGGSTSATINNIIYEASGGGGQGGGESGFSGDYYGGDGGGPYGGKGTHVLNIMSQPDATDPGKIGLNSGDGYVKIWAGYDPYFKG